MGLFARQVRKGAAPEPGPDGVTRGITLDQLIDMLHMGGIPRSKLSEATYFTCLRVLSEGVGKLPLKLLRTTEGNGVEEARDDPLFRVLRYRPNRIVPATRFWTGVEFARNHFGNAYVRIDDGADAPSLWQLPSQQVEVWWDDGHILSDQAKIWYIWTASDGRRYKFSDDEVLHFRTWLSLDGITGLSVQEILAATVDGGLRSQQMLNKLYENGFTAKAAVQYTGDLNDKLERDFIAGLERYATGQVDATKNFIPVPLGAKIEPLNIKLTDSQFIEVKKYTALQVAAAFGVKPNQINDYEKSSYANSEAQQLAFLTDTLLWIIKDYEEEITSKLVSEKKQAEGMAAKFNTAVILRADTKTQIESMAQAVSNSIYTPDEARAFLDMGTKPGGGQLYSNGNLIPLTLAGSQYTEKRGKEDG